MRVLARLTACLGCVVCFTCVAGCSLDRQPLTSARHGHGSTAGGGSAAVSGSDGAAGDPSAGNGTGGGGTSGLPDSDAGPGRCGTCDDGVFCNGVERCSLGDPLADAHGCVATQACLAGQTCNEGAQTCDTACDQGGDADGDGFVAVSCGGDDCDDAAPSANPSGVELCDGLDNDCNGAPDDGFATFSCLSNNTLASCTLGQCVITVCSTDYADCDQLVGNGCETSLNTVPGDCAGTDCSDKAVALPTDIPVDDGNECTVESCKAGVPSVQNAVDGTSCGNNGGDSGGGTCQQGKCQ